MTSLIFDSIFILFLMDEAVSDSILGGYIPSPIAFWPLNCKSKFSDYSGNGHDAIGSDVSMTKGVNGFLNTAYTFHGNETSYLRVNRTEDLDFSTNGSFSYTSLIYPTSQNGSLIEWNPTDGKYGTFIWNYPNSELFAHLRDRSRYSVYETVQKTITLNKWNFIGVSYDYGGRKIQLAVDGDTTTFRTGDIRPKMNVPYIYIGRRMHGDGADISYYSGRMMTVMLFNQALSHQHMMDIRSFVIDFNRVDTSSENVKSYKPFDLIGTGGVIKAARADNVTLAGSDMECAATCLETKEGCLAFSYSPATNECRLSWKTWASIQSDILSEPEGSNSTVYRMTNPNDC